MVGHRFPDAAQAVEYLKRTLNEREALEPRQKLLEDQQRIRNRKQLDPCIPLLPGHDQEAWFARLDNNGIWEVVFEYLMDPSDVTSAYFSCEVFRNNLEEKRKLMLLPMMFGVLRDTNRLNYVGFGWAGYNRRVSEEKQEENRDILRQRLVSKAWKKSAEEVFLVYEKFPQSFKRIITWDWEGPKVCCFKNEKDVDDAMDSLKNRRTSAPLLRMVKVDDVDDDEHLKECSEKEIFYSKLAKFFDTHGEAVWAVMIHQSRVNRDFNYEALCNITSKMPNLKGLYVDHHFLEQLSDEVDEGPDIREERREREFNAVNADLTSSVLRNNFPSLPALESFCVYSYPRQNEFLVSEILNKNSNLKTVFLGQWDHFEDETGTPIPSLVWESLRNLRLEHFEFLYDVPGPLFMHDFLQLRDFNWPLKYFRVHYNNEQNNYDYTFFDMGASIILEVMRHFNDTLEEFCFDGFTGVKLVNDWRGVVVEFPHRIKSITSYRNILLMDEKEQII